MIQRVQTLFLFIYSLLGIVSHISLAVEDEHFASWFSAHLALLDLFPLLLGIVALGIIFSYKKRKLQLGVIRVVIGLHLAYWGGFIAAIYAVSPTPLGLYPYHLVVSLVGLVTLFLAKKYIRKDEALIQSLDRLR